MAERRLGMVLNLENNAFVQRDRFDFESLAEFQGQLIGANEDGIYLLETGNTDNGTKIKSSLEFPVSNLGIQAPKRLRRMYFGHEAAGVMLLGVSVDQEPVVSYQVPPKVTGMKQTQSSVPLGSNEKGVYWTFTLENVDGCDFSIDLIDLLITVLGSQR